jgi:uncharacterized protein
VADKNKKPWYVGGLHFQCSECGNCCSGPNEGYIWATRQEIKFIADFLKEPVEQVRRKYMKRIGLRTTIIENPITKDCVFLKKIAGEKRCMIYPVRPNQCRTWPFWADNIASPNNWNETAVKCSGINRGRCYSCAEIEKIKRQKQWWNDGGK